MDLVTLFVSWASASFLFLLFVYILIEGRDQITNLDLNFVKMPREIKEIKVNYETQFISWNIEDLFVLFPSGFSPKGEEEGRQECQDQEECRLHQIQGPLLTFLVHLGHQGQGEGWEAEAVLAPRPSSQGTQVIFDHV
jgi:hypothetical protein